MWKTETNRATGNFHTLVKGKKTYKITEGWNGNYCLWFRIGRSRYSRHPQQFRNTTLDFVKRFVESC